MGSDFLGVRFSVQWLNRFASIYLEDPSLSPEEAGQVGALQMRVIEALAFEKNLLQLAVISRSVQGEVDQDAVSTYLAASNTSYSSTNLPRMGDRWGVNHFGPATRPFPPPTSVVSSPWASFGFFQRRSHSARDSALPSEAWRYVCRGADDGPRGDPPHAFEDRQGRGGNMGAARRKSMRDPEGALWSRCLLLFPRWRGAWPSARPVRAGEGTLRSTVSGGTQCYDET